MAGQTFLYGNASQQFASKQWDWLALTVWGMVVNSVYIPNANSDVHVSDIPSGAILTRIGPMTGQAYSNGICAGTLPTAQAFLAGTQAVGVVLYVNTGVDTTSSLIYYSSQGIGFPFLPQGFNYAISQDYAHAGWFQV